VHLAYILLHAVIGPPQRFDFFRHLQSNVNDIRNAEAIRLKEQFGRKFVHASHGEVDVAGHFSKIGIEAPERRRSELGGLHFT